jgi:hypothetical protein
MAGGAVQPKRARLASAALLVAALAALLPGARGGPPLMWLQGVLDIDPLAVCNDGRSDDHQHCTRPRVARRPRCITTPGRQPRRFGAAAGRTWRFH